MVFAAILVSFATFALAASNTGSWTPGQEVQTQSGLIKGHVAAWPAGSQISEYLGIPYAKPPVGSLRFAPPELNKSNATFVADKYVSNTVPCRGEIS
jgi:cholinesterase